MATSTVILLAFVWGVLWALFLQFNRWGQWLAQRRTWITVVIGFGVDLALLAAILEPHVWVLVSSVIAASAVGIVVRSLVNEHREEA